MFAQRLRGLINLHVILATIMAMLWLVMLAEIWMRMPWSNKLSEQLNMVPYVLCVGLGMILSGRFVHQVAERFHRLTLGDVAWLSTRQILLVASLVFAFMFAFKDVDMSRVFLGTYLLQCLGLLMVVNLGLPRKLSRLFFAQSHRVPTLFIGSLRGLDRLKTWLESKELLGMHPVGFLSLEGAPTKVTHPPYLGDLADLAQRIDDTGAGQVIMLEIPRTQMEGRHVIEACQLKGARLLIYSNLAEQLRHPLVTVIEERHQFYTLQQEPLEDPFNRLLKRSFDLLIALPVVLLALPPLVVIVAIMQRLQAPGPLFHTQMRTGYASRPFLMFKFRSMYVADPGESCEAQQARQGDSRVYPFGAFLRRTSLDEFPQFWNVLWGRMSAVGPRPHLQAHDVLFAQQMTAYRTRFLVKPGITGLAQCNGYRGEITEPELLQRRIELDLHYVANWSIWLDLQISIKTVRQIISPPPTAY